MKLLVLGREETYETRRLQETAVALGHSATVVMFDTLLFRTGANGAGIRTGEVDIPGDFDALFVASLNPFFSEVLTVAESFARAGKTVVDSRLATGNYIASKMYEGLVLAAAGISVPHTMQPLSHDATRAALKAFSFPLIMKGVHGGHGDHVYLVNDRQRAEQLIVNHPPGFFALQEYLPTDHDIRVIVIGYKAIGAMRRTIQPGEHRANIAKGATGSAAELTSELASLAEQASRALERECAGVDILIHKRRPYVLEVNQHPGFSAFEEATGVDIAAHIIRYIACLVKKAP